MKKPIVTFFTFLLFFLGRCVDDEMDTSQDGNNFTDVIIDLSLEEPSGLAFTKQNDALYTVSDNSGKIYKLSFDGQVIEELPFVGTDLEGIAIDNANGDIYIVEEGMQQIQRLNASGAFISKITSIHINSNNSGSGFEGIALNGDTLYVLFEKDPGLLIKYNRISGIWSQHNLSFALDYSGIDYDSTDSTLWIVSHESKTLNHCLLSGKLIASQKIDVVQAEGVAIDRKNNIAWIVSDKGNKLHRISLKI